MTENQNIEYLGRGWSFPPHFNNLSNEINLVESVQDIEQSLQVLLSTRPGERVMQPNYGCNLDIMIFEPLTTSLITYVKDLVKKAILFFEARIDADTIRINTENSNTGLILIEIDYTVRTTNSRFNFVFPFYLEEAANTISNV